ncbi:MAG: hypothetical protein NT025_08655 [bacterium]|nr:hypothetical protein [bacterium]
MSKLSYVLVFVVGLVLVIANRSSAQWPLECTSSNVSWIKLRADEAYRFYALDSLSLRIMTPGCSQTIQYTYLMNAEERSANYIQVQPDLTGDGISEIVLGCRIGSGPSRWTIKILNIVNGAALFQRSAPGYDYFVWGVFDFDGDGILECVIAVTDAASQTLEVYNTGAPASATAFPPDNQPVAFELEQNFPNPFNSSTRISYSIPVSGQVTVDVFNSIGQRVRTLVNERQETGLHFADWGSIGSGATPASGPYFYELKLDGKPLGARKMILLK